MGSIIYKLKEGDPDIKRVAEYSLPPKQALVAYIEQNYRNNTNTWEYPEIIKGMRESSTLADHWYYDVAKARGDKENAVISAYPIDTPLSCPSVIKMRKCAV